MIEWPKALKEMRSTLIIGIRLRRIKLQTININSPHARQGFGDEQAMI